MLKIYLKNGSKQTGDIDITQNSFLENKADPAIRKNSDYDP